MEEKILFTNGDSWTFGSEIMAPEFLVNQNEVGFGMANRYKKGYQDWQKCNDHYRIPRIWPTFLAESLGCKNVNLAWPARSNDTIYNTTVDWLLENYIIPRKCTKNLMVIIGWSSPERKNILIKDSDTVYLQTFWPAMLETNYYPSRLVVDYFKFYVQNLWLEQEYISRYVEQNHMLQSFCKSHGIKYHCFNAFYLTPGKQPDKWIDLNVQEMLDRWKSTKVEGWFDPAFKWSSEIRRLENLWNSLDGETFILKNNTPGSFKSYIYSVMDKSSAMINWHPSPAGHKAWADFLHTYIKAKHQMPEQKAPPVKRFSSMI
jgi:hypothetical protein